MNLRQLKWFSCYDWVILAYVVLATLLSRIYGFSIDYRVFLRFDYDIYFIILFAGFLCAVLLVKMLRLLSDGEDERMFGPTWRRYVRENYFTLQRCYDLARVLVLLKLVLTIYCSIKQAIPLINPHLHDQALLSLDRALHCGLNPMTFFAGLLGAAPIARSIDVTYIVWYLIKAPILATFILVTDRKLYERFYGAYFSLWIIGGLFAVVFPTLGPIYVYPHWFTELEMPFAARLQAMLWAHYQELLSNPQDYRVYVYEGIAAFPSLHVGVVALFSCFLFRLNRGLGWLLAVYTVIVLLGSVFLGWHYAVDGYFTILLALLLYRLSFRVIR